MCERRVTSPSRLVRLELARAAAHIDRAADRRIALAMCGGDLIPVAFRAVQLCSGRVARRDVDLELWGEVPELRKPEAVLVDEIEGEPVAARRDRAANVQVPFDAFSRRCV